MNRQQLYHVQLVLVYLLANGPIVIQSQTPSDDVWRRIIEDSYKAGPYNSFCNRTEPTEELPEDPTGNVFPCQLQCSCDPFTCGSKLPCCPDILENTVTTRNSSCLYPVMSKQPYNAFSYPKRHVQFPIRMVHDCVEGYIGTALHEKCLNFRSTTDLDHMVPVISNKTGIVYVNRFCAECSNELNFTAFESYFACWTTLFDKDNWESLVLERTLENELKLIQEGFCVYVFKPSEEQRVEENKCLQVDYNTCNQTGTWDFEDPYFEAACDAYELPYWWLDTVYRNYHCAVCNGRLSWKKRPLCAEVNQFVLRISFYALINLDLTDVIGSDLISTEHDKQRCGNESVAIFDNYLTKCRRPHCPLFHVRKDDKCIPVYNGLDIAIKGATILFEEVNKTEKVLDPYSNFTTDVLPVVQKEIIRGILNASSVFHLLFLQKQSTNNSYESDFIISYMWYSTADEELVPEKVKRFFNHVVVNVSLLHTSGFFKARLITNFEMFTPNMVKNTVVLFQQNSYSTIFVYVDSHFLLSPVSSSGALSMSKLLICNRVTLSLSEFNRSGDSIILQSGDVIQLTQAYIVTSSGIHLCLDDYIDIIEDSNSAAVAQNESLVQEIVVILSFVCSIISMVGLLVTIVIYGLLKPLRTVPGKLNVCLCVSLLVSQILQQFTMDLVEYPTACIVFGVLIHVSWLATLFWMNVSSFNLFRIFSPGNIRSEIKSSLLMYSLYVVGMSVLLVVVNIVYSFFSFGDENIGYGHAGQSICYISSVHGLLLTFVTPVGAIVLSNIVFLVVTVWRISRTPLPEGSKSTDRNNVLIYIKMSTLTGSCWLFGLFRILTGAYVFEILFILTNASQGLFLMLSFVCNKRVLALLRGQFQRV